MKVYCLFDMSWNEGKELLGIFKNEDDAKAAVEDLKRQTGDDDLVYIYYEEWSLE